jgi:hypothetical protein
MEHGEHNSAGPLRRWLLWLRWQGRPLLLANACLVVALLVRQLPLDSLAPAPLPHAGSPNVLAVGKEFFVRQRVVHGARLVAKGSTHFHLFMMPVCSSVLYLEQQAQNADVLTAVPKALELAYHRAVPAADFRASTRTLIERNGLLGNARVARLVDEYNALYVDIKPGDRYLLEWHPRAAVCLRHNGKLLGRVGTRDAEFAAALFSVWFGSKAFHPVFRADLLRPLALPAAAVEPKCRRRWRPGLALACA